MSTIDISPLKQKVTLIFQMGETENENTYREILSDEQAAKVHEFVKKIKITDVKSVSEYGKVNQDNFAVLCDRVSSIVLEKGKIISPAQDYIDIVNRTIRGFLAFKESHPRRDDAYMKRFIRDKATISESCDYLEAIRLDATTNLRKLYNAYRSIYENWFIIVQYVYAGSLKKDQISKILSDYESGKESPYLKSREDYNALKGYLKSFEGRLLSLRTTLTTGTMQLISLQNNISGVEGLIATIDKIQTDTFPSFTQFGTF